MTTTDTSDTRTIHERLIAVQDDLPAIGKGGYNTQQQYAFRGIEHVLTALNPILCKHGVFVVPTAVKRIADVRESSRGNKVYAVALKVRFTFYGILGDSVEAVTWGEGTDSLDKATNKAHTGAYKNALHEVFAISSAEQAATDPDRQSGRSNSGDDDGDQSNTEPFVCPVCDAEGKHWEHIDVEKFRDHMVKRHEWTRLEDGRVSRRARTGDPATDPKPGGAGPAPVERPVDPPEVEGDEETRDVDEALTPESIKAMDKKALVGELNKRGLGTSGSLDTLRTRLSGAMHTEAQHPKAQSGSTPTATSDAQQPTLEPVGDTANSPDSPATSSASSTSPDDETGDIWECPEDGCDAFPFTSEEDYTEHWNAVHGAGPAEGDGSSTTPDDDAAGDTPEETAASDDADAGDPPLDAENVAEVKKVVGTLQGEKARAYAKYRRGRKLGKPEDLTLSQGMDLLEFLYELTGA
jgi:hypothetical protein